MSQPVLTGRHPKALYILFFTEMWERFAYYLMVGILLLYMIDSTTGGKGFDQRLGADIVGSFIALVYLTPFIGGLIADRYLGYIKSIFIGGFLMASGYICLAVPGNTAMFIGLAMIIFQCSHYGILVSWFPFTNFTHSWLKDCMPQNILR